MSARKILVTGGAGYLGSILVAALLDNGYDVVVLDTLIFTDVGIRPWLNHSSFRFVNGDIRDPGAIHDALTDVDIVIHLAAVANDPSGDLNPGLTRAVNLDVYEPLLNACHKAGISRFLNASTFSVYGIMKERDVTEDHPLQPLKEYSRCKALSENVVRDFNGACMTTTSLRCATICGWSPRMRFDLIANTLIGAAIEDRRLVVLGGAQERPQIHIQDLCDIFLSLIDAPANLIGGEVFNAGGPNLSIEDIAHTAQSVLDDEVQLERLPARDDERSYHVSSTKIEEQLGLKSVRPVADAMTSIVSAYRENLWSDYKQSQYHNVRHLASSAETTYNS